MTNPVLVSPPAASVADSAPYDVIVLGGGPTGLVLANLLGLAGVRTVVIERAAEVYPVPRATHIDEETLRHFQLTGLMPALAAHTSPFGVVDLLDADGDVVFQEEVAQPHSVHHYVGSRFFDQPAFERILRDGLTRFAHVRLLAGAEADGVVQTATGVTATVRLTPEGQALALHGAWLVGADGGRSLVREALHINMDSLEPAREWVIVDSLLRDPADARLLPDRFQYHFLPDRLTIFAAGFGLNNRWEFQLGKDEAMPAEDVVLGWVARFIPLDRLTITRVARYAHHSLVAQQWRAGRLFLAGDAAHMMPPSAGQGLCSGVRDAVNLAWKLAAVVQGRASAVLLDTYEQERKPHLREILRRTLFFGNRLQGDDALQRLWREVQLRAIEWLKPLKEYLRRSYNTPPKLGEGCLSTRSALAGHHLPQVTLPDGTLSDDGLGYCFTLVARAGALPPAVLTAAQAAGCALAPPALAAAYEHWLNKHHLDYALVRPDKVLFGVGTRTDFAAVWQELTQAALFSPVANP